MRKKLSILATFVGILAIGGWLIACNNSDDLAIQNNNGKQEKEIPTKAWEKFAIEQNAIISQLMTSNPIEGIPTRTIADENRLYDKLESLISNFMTKYISEDDYDSFCGTDTTEIEVPEDSIALASEDQLDLVLAHSSKAFAEIMNSFMDSHTFNLSDKDIIANKELRNIEKLKLLIINATLKNHTVSISETDKSNNDCQKKYNEAMAKCALEYGMAIAAACSLTPAAAVAIAVAASTVFYLCTKNADEAYQECNKKSKKL